MIRFCRSLVKLRQFFRLVSDRLTKLSGCKVAVKDLRTFDSQHVPENPTLARRADEGIFAYQREGVRVLEALRCSQRSNRCLKASPEM